MTIDKAPATLATVKHGGCVQLGKNASDRVSRLKERIRWAQSGHGCNILHVGPKHFGARYVVCFGINENSAGFWIATWENEHLEPRRIGCFASEEEAKGACLVDAVNEDNDRYIWDGIDFAPAPDTQPSPGGQGDAHRQWLEVRGLAAGIVKNLQAFADSPHKAAWCGALDDSLSFADQIEKDADTAYKAALAARQPSPGSHGAIGEALLWLRGALDCKNYHWDADQREAAEHAYKHALAEHQSAGNDPAFYLSASAWGHIRVPMTPTRDVKAFRHGFDHGDAELVPFYAGPPAQAVDLGPASIPDTPEVRDILGRPNFWCSPWANVLRMRGDAIPRKAEEEQAAVIRFMLNHYLANGADWAETAGAELDAIRKADSQAVGNG